MEKIIKSKLILVNIVLRTDAGELRLTPQMGLLYIATVAKQAGYDVEIISGENLVNKIINGVKASQTLVGFYVNSDNCLEVFRTSHYLKKIDQSIKIIFGGPLANVDPRVLFDCPVVDFVGSGDGEYLVLELLQALDANCDEFSFIDGLSYRHLDKVIVNKPRSLNKKLDELPIPDRSIDKERSYISPAMITTSRGCGFKCTFCYESTNRQYRYNSPVRIIEEMKYLRDEFGVTCFSFTDDIFTTHQKRLVEICSLMRTEFQPGEDLFWFCEARVDTLSRNPELITIMKKSGLTRIQIGVESGDQGVIDLYKKEITLEEVRNAVSKLNQEEVMSIYTNFIIGGAGETEVTFQNSLKFMVELMYMAPGRLECGACYLSPYPGTDINKNPSRYNVEIIDGGMLTGTSLGGVFVETVELDVDVIKQYKHIFVETMFKVMTDIASKIDSSLIREHLVSRSISMATLWSDFFMGDKILSSWFNFYNSGEYTYKTIGKSDSLDFIFPTRCFPSERVVDKKLIWPIRSIKLEFTTMENYIIDHCSGKLSLFEIAQMTHHKFGDGVEFGEFIKDVVSYINELSGEHLIIHRSLR